MTDKIESKAESRDEVLKRMLKMRPTPHATKPPVKKAAATKKRRTAKLSD